MLFRRFCTVISHCEINPLPNSPQFYYPPLISHKICSISPPNLAPLRPSFNTQIPNSPKVRNFSVISCVKSTQLTPHRSNFNTQKLFSSNSSSIGINCCGNQPKLTQQRPKLETGRFFSSNSQMGDARRPVSVPIPDIERADRVEVVRALEASLGSSFSSEPLVPQANPLIVVISGPSGVGKDAVITRLREVRENMHFVVTATSRDMRPGEVDGKDYYFVTKDEFLGMVEKDELLEHALVYGDYKGIPKQQIREFMARGCDIVLRVDIQGAATLRRILGDSAVFVFVVAESEYAMVNRLIGRKTETREMLLVRIATAREEVKHARNFDYVVVNADGELEKAVKLVDSIIDAEKAKVRQRNVRI